MLSLAELLLLVTRITVSKYYFDERLVAMVIRFLSHLCNKIVHSSTEYTEFALFFLSEGNQSGISQN